jgi:hypothetical protein
MKADAEALGLLEQRSRLLPRHLALEPGVDVALVLEEPAREEGGERQLGIDDKVAAHSLRLPHQRDQPRHDLGSGLAARDRPKLRRAHGDDPTHFFPPRTSSALRPTSFR